MNVTCHRLARRLALDTDSERSQRASDMMIPRLGAVLANHGVVPKTVHRVARSSKGCVTPRCDIEVNFMACGVANNQFS